MMKNARMLATVHTHTHTQGNLIKYKKLSINSALLNVYARDG